MHTPEHQPDTSSAITPPEIVAIDCTHIHSPWHLLSTGLALSVIMPVFVVGSQLVAPFKNPGILVGMLIGCAVFVAVPCGLGLVSMGRWRRAKDSALSRQAKLDAQDIEGRVQAALEISGGPKGPRPSLDTAFRPAPLVLRHVIAEAGLPTRLVIVDRNIADRLRQIPLPDSFLEPDWVESAPRKWSGTYWFMVIVGVIYFLANVIPAALRGTTGGLNLVTSLAVFLMFAIPVARAMGFRFGAAMNPIVGMGTLTDRKGRRWTIQDTVVFITSLRVFHEQLRVHIDGPQGSITLHYGGGLQDEGFVRLWRGWMHAHPRPDLG